MVTITIGEGGKQFTIQDVPPTPHGNLNSNFKLLSWPDPSQSLRPVPDRFIYIMSILLPCQIISLTGTTTLDKTPDLKETIGFQVMNFGKARGRNPSKAYK